MGNPIILIEIKGLNSLKANHFELPIMPVQVLTLVLPGIEK
jgi:hypothetical protein